MARELVCRAAGAAWLTLTVCAAARAQSPVDGFDPGANDTIRAIAVQSDGKILVGGDFTTIAGGGTGVVSVAHIARLKHDGSIDAAIGADGPVYTLAVQPDGKILVAGSFSHIGGGGTGSEARHNIARLNANGSIDATFDPGANGLIDAIALQPDGRIVVGGSFTMIGGGGTGATPRSRIARLAADGAIDAGFDPGANAQVFALALHPDESIIAAGAFTALGGGGTGATPRQRIGRLTANGEIDVTFNANIDDTIRAIALQPNGMILIGGDFLNVTGYGSTRQYLTRVNGDGTPEATLNTNVDGPVHALALRPDGVVVVGGDFQNIGFQGGGSPCRGLALVKPGDFFHTRCPGANGSVRAAAVQPDGNAVVGGTFTKLGGGTGVTDRSRIGRVYPDFGLDATFDPNLAAQVLALALQPDGRILVGGHNQFLTRLLADGAADLEFSYSPPEGVYAIAIQPDGRVLIGGTSMLVRLFWYGAPDPSFTPGASGAYAIVVLPDGKLIVGGLANGAGFVKRLTSSGAVDAGFAASTLSGAVNALAVQPDGHIVVGGAFSTITVDGGAPTPRAGLARLNADGSLDPSFNPGIAAFGPAYVQALAAQGDGAIVVGGRFDFLGNAATTPRTSIGRLNGDGSLDADFHPAVAHGGEQPIVNAFALQADGGIFVGGYFTTPGQGVVRLGASGSVDAAFDGQVVGGTVYGLAVQRDGKVVVGGQFTALSSSGGSVLRNNIGRFTNTQAATETLTATEETITWLRGAAAPEVWRVTFESSTDGTTFTTLGAGTRMAGGWQLTGQSLPVNHDVFVRARGYAASGFGGGSDSVLESVSNVYFAHVPQAPAVVTGAATAIGPFTATLNGTANPRSLTTVGSFEFGLTAGYGSATAEQDLGSGAAAVPIGGGTLSDLACNTSYHFGAAATNSVGTTHGADATFTTASCPAPTVTTGVAIGAGTSWTLTGTANPNGTQTSGQFQYGLTAAYGRATPLQSMGSGMTPQSIGGGGVSGLHCNTQYHFRAIAANTGGPTTGNDATFATSCAFTDDPLIAGVTVVKAVHFEELRARIDLLRSRYGLASFGWGAPLIPGASIISVWHIGDLRFALFEAYNAAGLPPPVYTDSGISSYTTPVKAVHIAELRTAVIALEQQ